MQTETTPSRPWNGEARTSDVMTPHPNGDRNIRRAMMAAVPIVGDHRHGDDLGTARSGCRILAGPGDKEIEILATSLQRAASTRLAAARRNVGSTVDTPVPHEAVRAIARGEFDRLDIVIGDDGSLSLNGKRGRTEFDAVPGVDTARIRGVLGTPSADAIVASVTRSEALKALRRLRPDRRRHTVFRLEAGTAGLLAAPAPDGSGHGGRPPEPTRIGSAEAVPRANIVFGLYVAHLIETLRTMGASVVRVYVENPSRPVHLIGSEGNQHFALATRRV